LWELAARKRRAKREKTAEKMKTVMRTTRKKKRRVMMSQRRKTKRMRKKRKRKRIWFVQREQRTPQREMRLRLWNPRLALSAERELGGREGDKGNGKKKMTKTKMRKGARKRSHTEMKNEKLRRGEKHVGAGYDEGENHHRPNRCSALEGECCGLGACAVFCSTECENQQRRKGRTEKTNKQTNKQTNKHRPVEDLHLRRFVHVSLMFLLRMRMRAS
jgi:hypothetical protein